ncbi:hypothetical protein Fmac_004512 [Flemingia macrophylla]|uniref:Uncharacterized protein n=1 Tax=Flemingia macrophylla TaxID=520843 RepID=A0ABD1N541_9FABA
MPSGPKKRKAARRKKQKESNINLSSDNPKGNDDLKSQDEKGSDGGERNSPGYHEHDDHCNQFNGGSDKLEERGPSAAQPHASDVKIDRVLGGEEGGVVVVERGSESEGSSESTNLSLENIETAKESYHGDGNGQDTSKVESFTEKRGSESKNVCFEHIETAKKSYYEDGNGDDTSKGESFTVKNSEDGNNNSLEKAIASHELVKSIGSSPSKMISTTDMAPIEETVNSDSDPVVTSVKAMASVSEVEKSDRGSVLVEKSVDPVEATNFAMKVNEDKAYPLTNENVTTPNVEEPKPKECDSEVLASLSAGPFTKFTNGGEHMKDSKPAEQSENQPHVLTSKVVKKTSWLSCCGLFEVLSS